MPYCFAGLTRESYPVPIVIPSSYRPAKCPSPIRAVGNREFPRLREATVVDRTVADGGARVNESASPFGESGRQLCAASVGVTSVQVSDNLTHCVNIEDARVVDSEVSCFLTRRNLNHAKLGSAGGVSSVANLRDDLRLCQPGSATWNSYRLRCSVATGKREVTGSRIECDGFKCVSRD